MLVFVFVIVVSFMIDGLRHSTHQQTKTLKHLLYSYLLVITEFTREGGSSRVVAPLPTHSTQRSITPKRRASLVSLVFHIVLYTYTPHKSGGGYATGAAPVYVDLFSTSA